MCSTANAMLAGAEKHTRRWRGRPVAAPEKIPATPINPRLSDCGSGPAGTHRQLVRRFALHDFLQQVQQLMKHGKHLVISRKQLDSERVRSAFRDLEFAIELLAQFR